MKHAKRNQHNEGARDLTTIILLRNKHKQYHKNIQYCAALCPTHHPKHLKSFNSINTFTSNLQNAKSQGTQQTNKFNSLESIQNTNSI